MIGRTIAIVLALTLIVPSFGSPAKDGSESRVHVRGYTRKDGTYVRPHTRSWPRTKSAHSAPLMSRPEASAGWWTALDSSDFAPSVSGRETSASQAPMIYYNPFVRQPGDARQNATRDAMPSASAVTETVTEADRVKARKILAILDSEDARCSIQESALQEFTNANRHRLTASDKAGFDALRDTFKALRRQRGELRNEAEAVAVGKADMARTHRIQERLQSYIDTLNEQKALAILLDDRAKELYRHADAKTWPEKNPVRPPSAENREVEMADMIGAYSAVADPEQGQQQAEFDSATARLHSLFTSLVGAVKTHQVTKDEFATGILNVALQQMELNKKVEAHNRQHPLQAVRIDARHMWYEQVDHIVSEVIPRR